MKKEKVLEIETQEVFDKVAVRIKHQNFGVLKRVEFYDEETEVESFLVSEYIKDDNKLYVQGKEESKDSKEWKDFWAKVRAKEIGGDE